MASSAAFFRGPHDKEVIHPGIQVGASIVTASGNSSAHWLECDGGFLVNPAITTAIETLTADRAPLEPPCLLLPDPAFAEPRRL